MTTSSKPLAFLSRHWNNARKHQDRIKRGRRRNQPVAGINQPAVVHCRAELLESRLLLSVTAPASATVIEQGILTFSQTRADSITVDLPPDPRNPNLPPSGTVALSVAHGTLTLGSTSGLRFIAGANGSASMTVGGTEANLNAGLHDLNYLPTLGYNGDDSLSISANRGRAGSATVSLFINTWTGSTIASQTMETTVAGRHGFDLTLLLPNGDLMLHQAGTSKNWYEITPDSAGSYANGTWTQLASMNVARQYFSSDVLPNGDVFVLGGEYASDGQRVTSKGKMDSSSAEIYDPATNVWTLVAPDPHTYPPNTVSGQPSTIAMGGDEPSEVLPDGTVLVGNIWDNGTEIYTPATNSWSNGPMKVHTNDRSDEESWVKLPDGDILTYDIKASIADDNGEAERLVGTSNPTTMHWEDASAGNLPILTTDATDGELGPALLGPGGGAALFTGANGLTAYYHISQNSWTPGPKLPSITIAGVQTQLTAGDAPGAVMPNGDVLLALSPAVFLTRSGIPQFPSPTFIYEFDSHTNVFTYVTPSVLVQNLTNINTFHDSMLILPSGQTLLTNSSGALAFYALAPGDGPDPSWAPAITSFTQNADGSYTLTGTQLNGRYEGAAYGDDKQMAENYPLVQLIDLFTGTVYYAKTSNWSSTGVATGNTPETVNVVLPPGIGSNGSVPFLLFVIADGIPSVPILRFFAGPGPNLVVNGALANPSEGRQIRGVGVPAAPGANDNSSGPLMLSVANVTPVPAPTPISRVDYGSNNPESTPVIESAHAFNSALDRAESIHIAGLNAALDILSG